MRSRAGMGLAAVVAVGVGAAALLWPLPAAPSRAVAQGEQGDAAGKAFTVDRVHSTVIFGVRHLGAGNSYGRFNSINGSFLVNPEDPTGSFVKVTVDVDSIDTGNANRDEHLRSPDFFDAKAFPTATFSSTSIRKTEAGLEMTGDLTIHGTTKRITVPLEFLGEGAHPRGGRLSGIELEFAIKRSDFGITYMPEGLGDDVRMIVALEGGQR